MNVLHLVAGEISGGAAKGAYWLHCGLKACGINSKILTNSRGMINDQDIVSVNESRFSTVLSYVRRLPDYFLPTLYPGRNKGLFSTGLIGYDFTKHDLYRWADVIHLHWINLGFVNVRHLSFVEKPIIWTLRDMWPMTGGCHCSMACDHFKYGCGRCAQLGSRRMYDLSYVVARRKARFYPKNMRIVGISKWLSEKARESWLFRTYKIETISNNFPSGDFFPIEKKLARQILGVNTSKKILLVGAISFNDPWKGYDKLLAALHHLKSDDYMVLSFGKDSELAGIRKKYEYYNLGYISDVVSLRLVYSAGDVFLGPSLQEAFGKTLVESLACGTPVVCFDATGPRDIVDHQINGYKARPYDPLDFAFGINWIVNSADYETLRKNGVEKAVNNYDNKVIAKKYIELYNCIG